MKQGGLLFYSPAEQPDAREIVLKQTKATGVQNVCLLKLLPNLYTAPFKKSKNIYNTVINTIEKHEVIFCY